MADRVLLITTDAGFANRVRAACARLDAEVDVANTDAAAEALLVDHPRNLVVCDYPTFVQLRARHPQLCALLYALPGGNSEEAIEAIKQGALDYLVHPVEDDVLTEHIGQALRISRDVQIPAIYDEPKTERGVERIIGQSPAMKEVYKLIGLIAPRDVNVLVTGESGTGKELVARALLHHSPRRERPFLAVNCAAIPETLLESELFGHEKGAFTGANARRIGKFEQCDGGTLFLDEVGDIPLATQAKLLRVLQDNSFQRLGGSETIHSDVRIVAATHQSLADLIRERRFRQDLFYRLKVASIDVPPLREREVDVVLLAHYFVDRHRRHLGAEIRSFAPETLPILLRYPWPGNVRELENAIKAALVVARGPILRPEFLPEHIRSNVTNDPAAALSRSGDLSEPMTSLRQLATSLLGRPEHHGQLHAVAVARVEQEIIRACLQHTQGQIAPAAKLLGISRTTLRKRMSEHGIRATVMIDSVRPCADHDET